MAGFPWHALEDNIKVMLKAGHKVTVAEQEKELREGAKLLERVVTRVYLQEVCMRSPFLEQMNAHCLFP